MDDTEHESVAVIDELLELKNRALEETAEGITISDPSLPDNPIIYANRGFTRLTGYAVADVLGRNCRFLQGPGTDPAAAARIREALAAERAVTVEILNYRKDGSTFWNRLSITPVRDGAGRTSHFIGVQSDITQRREVEDRLRLAKAEVEAYNRRLLLDQQTAARMQQALLPQAPPSFEPYRFAWAYRPCERLAGDTLNIFPLDADHVALYVLDVSGHGVSAALPAVMLNRWLTPKAGSSAVFVGEDGASRGLSVRSPAAVAERLNRQFPMEQMADHFFTLLYGVLDRTTGTLSYVSAGHPPLIFAPADGEPVELEHPGYPIGITERPAYEEKHLRLCPGDRAYIYSDGITEAADGGGEPLGAAQLRMLIAAAEHVPLAESVTAICRRVEHWCDPQGLQDDVSLVAVEHAPTPRPRE